MRLLLLFTFGLAACAPAPVYLPAGEVLPEHAVRVLDAATSTARVQATQNAVSTDTRRATVEAYGDAWTATALAQSLALERDAATQRAGETATAGQWTQAALVGAATGTAEARAFMATAAVGEAQALAAAQERAERERAGWRVVPFGLLGIAAAAAFVVVREWQRGYRRRIEVAATRAQIVETQYGMVLHAPPAPPLLLAEARVLENPEWDGDEWTDALARFAAEASALGSFSLRATTAAGIVSDPAWRALTGSLVEAGVLRAQPRMDWAEGWNYVRLRRELESGELRPPHPAGPAPEVRMARNTARERMSHAEHARAA